MTVGGGTDKTDNTFHNKDGEQNVAQGERPIGKQVNNYGISPEVFAEYAGKLAVTDSALRSFFTILEEQQVSLNDLDSKLREIAGQYKELLLRIETVQSEDPQVVKLKLEAKQAIEAGDYAKAEELLNQAEARDVEAIEQLEASAKQRRISAATSCADNARLQEVQLRYAKAATVLPQDSRKERADYLNVAGHGLHRIDCYKDALPLFKQSLAIFSEIDNKVGKGGVLNNIGLIYTAESDYSTALDYLEQSLNQKPRL